MYYDPSQHLDSLGIARPEGVDNANAAHAKIRSLAAGEHLCEVAPHTTTAEHLVERMREYVEGRALQAYAREIEPQFGRQARQEVREAYAADASRLLEELRAATTSPLKLITTAAQHIGPDDDGASVVERDQAVIKAWRNREQIDAAADTLDSILGATQALADLTGNLPSGEFPTLLWWTEVSDHHELDALEEVWSADCPGSGYLALAHAGHELRLATPDQLAKRVVAVASSRHMEAIAGERAQAEQERAKVDAYNRRRARLESMV